jgi:hypothetical protein
MAPAIKPPICAHHATASAAIPAVLSALRIWIRNQMGRKMSAGTWIKVIKKKTGTSVRILALGKARMYAPSIPAIAPLAPIMGTSDPGADIMCAILPIIPTSR